MYVLNNQATVYCLIYRHRYADVKISIKMIMTVDL